MTPARTICLGFLTVITVGAILLMLPISLTNHQWSDPITALFISTSAVCVTGLSVVDVGKYYSFFGEFVVALLAQIGGLGYMTATTFLLLILGRRFGLKDKLALQQSLDMPGISGVLQLVKSIIGATLLFELTGAFLLLGAFVPQLGWNLQAIWFSVFHSVSAFNNAGFGLYTDNFMQFVESPVLNFTITGLIIFGGIGYQAIMEVFFWGRSRLGRNHAASLRPDRFMFSLNFKIVTTTTLALLLIGTVAILVTEFNNPATLGNLSWNGKLLAAWFQSVTTRTAGFNTIDNGKLGSAALFVTIALMFVGASPGSTGGGIKTTTIRILTGVTRAVLQGQSSVILFNRQIPMALIMKAIAVFLGSLSVVVVSTILLTLFDPAIPFVQLFFEVVSAFATVGLSTGITAQLSVGGKLVLIGTMYIGRVGILLLMSTLISENARSVIRYPEEELLVG